MDVLNFGINFESETFFKYVLKLRGVEFQNFTVQLLFSDQGEFTSLFFHIWEDKKIIAWPLQTSETSI